MEGLKECQSCFQNTCRVLSPQSKTALPVLATRKTGQEAPVVSKQAPVLCKALPRAYALETDLILWFISILICSKHHFFNVDPLRGV